MIKTFFSKLLGPTVLLLARSALKVAGGAIISWLVAKHVDPGQASNLVDYLSGAALTGLGIFLSVKNKQDTKATTAMSAAAAYDAGHAQGQQDGVDAQAASDTTKVAAVAQAMQTAAAAPKEDKAALVAALKSGSF